jgi:hypothetical protein
VTWVAGNPMEEVLLPTRTVPPPSSTPTEGPSPTPTDITPTLTPTLTPTPSPTPTPDDFAFEAPFLDTIDEPIHWRANAQPFLGTDDWLGQYYLGMNFNTLYEERWNRELGLEFRGVLNFDWGQGGPFQAGRLNDAGLAWSNDTFSVRYSRLVYIPETITITFTATYDDGVRLYLLAPGETTNNCNDCLLINDWNNGTSRSSSSTRTIDGRPGELYTLQVDYYENTGSARISLDYTIPSNVDDTVVNNSGVPVAGPVNCNWGRSDNAQDPNSLDWMWEEYLGGRDVFPRNMRCHLEFRGYVTVPEDMEQPQFVFWDVWDMGTANLRGWLEVAEYIHDPLGPGTVLDRDAVVWHPVNLHQGATTNYNWTRHVVDLRNVNGNDFRGKDVTFRFVMQNLNTDNRRRWYIDDIEFLDAAANGGMQDFLPGTRLELNDPDAANDFITSGHWALTNTNALPNPDTPNAPGCCSWELMPGGNYARFSVFGASGGTAAPDNVRVHYVELNGWVDFSGNLPDDQGNTGHPMLSFYQGHYVGRRTGLEVQYTTDPHGVGPANWQVVPGADPTDPYGRIVDLMNESDTDNRSLTLTEVSLREVPAQRFRLRFAVLVRQNATLRQGWWIDDIYLHREGRPFYLDYPFLDNAEAGVSNWLPSGQWFRTNQVSRVGEHSFTDSPFGNYSNNTNTTFRTLHPIDFQNNSPENLALDDRNPAGGNSGGAAVDPVMSFWLRRDLNQRDHLHVEWRRYDESDHEWKRLWSYTYGMHISPIGSRDSTSTNLAWEFVHIELSPITRTFIPGDTDSSDIMFRFRLEADGSSNADGVYIDDIRISERAARPVHRLWPTGENRSVGGTSYGNGSGAIFGADVDEPDWFTRWFAQGNWIDVTYEQRGGLRSWHDSTDWDEDAEVQSRAPYFVADNQADDVLTSQARTYNILELNRIFDLRATQATERPTLYFWSRYHIARADRISVEVSEELTLTGDALDTHMRGRCPGNDLLQCYQQNYGWSEWRPTEFHHIVPNLSGANLYTYTWQREQVSLVPYAAVGTTPGSRIRIRFVIDTLDRGNQNEKRDGWYIDNVTIRPRQDGVIRRITDGAFFDPARNLQNWVTEGNWGLDPEFFRGSGGGPANLGSWQESWWYYRPVCTGGNIPNCVGNFLNNNGAGAPAGHPLTRVVPQVNYDMRRDGPDVPGWNPDHVDHFAGRWVLDTPVVGTGSGVLPGDYTFITVSDDGVRMKFEEINAAGNVIPSDDIPPGWNIILNWTNHARTVDMGTANLKNGRRYRLTLEYFENTGDAVVILSVGGSSFSFTDNPKQGAGPDFPGNPSIPRGNSSLILDGTLDLVGTANPVLEYYTYYNNRGALLVEVSTDGGFNWQRPNSMRDPITLDSGLVETMDPTVIPDNQGWMPNNGDWQRRLHNMGAFRTGSPIMIRFRMDRIANEQLTRNSIEVGWWIVDVRVADIGP